MLNKVVGTALYSNHMIQLVVQKILIDRMLPTGIFEKAEDSWEKTNIVIDTIRPAKETIGGDVVE